MPQNTTLIYVASSKAGHDAGAHIFELDMNSGALNVVEKITAFKPGQYVAFHPENRFLYLTGAPGGKVEETPGAVAAFSLDPQSGKATYLNQQPTGGNSPCYVTVDRSGRYVLGVNYSGEGGAGNVWVFPIQEDGSLGEATDHIRHEGRSIHPDRQRESHTHQIEVLPDNRFVFVNDLGTDKVMVYRLNLETGKLDANEPPYAKVAPGSGPRHLDFADRHVYLINELNNTVIVFDYDHKRGSLIERQTVSTLPDDFRGENYAADIHVAPSGRFLYGSNRGHNSIAIFEIDSQTGELTLIDTESVQGDWPRTFSIEPSGRLLIVANQRSGNVVTFWIDEATGRLTPTGHSAEVPEPTGMRTLVLQG